MSSPLYQRISEDYKKAFKEYGAFILGWEQQNTQYFKEQNWQAMLDNSLAAQKRELSPARQKDIQSSIDFARQKLAEKKARRETRTGIGNPNAAGSPNTRTTGPGPGRRQQIGYTGTDRQNKPRTGASFTDPPAPPNPPVDCLQSREFGLKLAKTIYAPNEEIALDFSASSAVPANAWVGLIPAGVAHGSNARNDQHDTTFQAVKRQAFGSDGSSGRRPRPGSTISG